MSFTIIDDASVSILSHEEVVGLCQRIEQGDQQARDQLILANLRLVSSIVSRYPQSVLVDGDDLFQEGVRGLMHAIKKFDYKKGFKFSTYATTWIAQYISRFCATSRYAVHMPYHVDEDVKKVRQAREALNKAGEDATPEQIAAQTQMSLELVEDLLQWISPVLSLSAAVGADKNGDTISYGEILPDRVDDAYIEADTHMLISQLLACLNDNQRETIEMRYGVGSRLGKEICTLVEAGKMRHISRERIRQLEEDALKKMRKELVG